MQTKLSVRYDKLCLSLPKKATKEQIDMLRDILKPNGSYDAIGGFVVFTFVKKDGMTIPENLF